MLENLRQLSCFVIEPAGNQARQRFARNQARRYQHTHVFHPRALGFVVIRAVAHEVRDPAHDPAYEGEVDTVYLGCWRRDTFTRIGGFDESLERNQDDEWNLRLTLAGGTIWQDPRIRSWYSVRPSLRALWKQYFDYGFWKVAVIRKHGRPASWRHLAPGLFLLANVVLLPLKPVLAAALDAPYLAASLVFSLAAAARSGWTLLPALPPVFAVYHFAYGLGFLRGCLKAIR